MVLPLVKSTTYSIIEIYTLGLRTANITYLICSKLNDD